MKCANVTSLKLISVSFLVLAFILHVVGITSKRWDYIYVELYSHQYDAYQNLWIAYDADLTGKFSFSAMYNRVTQEIPEWKMNIIYLETTALAIVVYAVVLLVVNSTCTSDNRNVSITMNTLCIIGCFISCGESIAGVNMYLKSYMKTVSINGMKIIAHEEVHNHRDIYHLAWAPYLCITSGSLYGFVGILIIIDVIVTIARERAHVIIHPANV